MSSNGDELIVIDGSIMEGGGQVLRNTASLSALLGKPIKVINIRANRTPKPGLRSQHLTGLQVVENLFNGSLEGGYVNSSEIVFHPGEAKHGKFSADIGTAGSICLLVQIALPCMLFGSGRTEYTFRGGTNAEKAPMIDYFFHVFGPLAKNSFGFSYDLQLIKRGFFPKGGGEVRLVCDPIQSLKPIVMTEQGEVQEIQMYAYTAGQYPEAIGKRMIDAAESYLKKKLANGKIQYTRHISRDSPQTAVGTGAGILIVAKTSTGCLLGGSALLDRKTKAEQAGEKAATELLTNIQHGGAVDEWAQDQIILFMALAEGHSKVLSGPLTLHTRTAIHFSELMTGAKFTVTEVPESERKKSTDNTYWIECDGIGYRNKYVS